MRTPRVPRGPRGPRGPRDPNIPPSGPLFTNAPGASSAHLGDFPGTEREREAVAQLQALISSGQLGGHGTDQHPGRIDQFLPYLLVRAYPGDNGTRPTSGICYESCDIWTAPGDPSVSPAIPATIGGVVTAGQPHTLYAHVWNLGHAPVAAVRVEFYWSNPALGVDGNSVQLIGMARVDLAPNVSQNCHRLVKCPKPWVPSFVNGGHECLVVRVEGFGDAIGANPWATWYNRHVAQRNIAVVQQAQNVSALVASLQTQAQSSRAARIELSQVGAEAASAVRMMAPQLRLDPAIKTKPLASLERGKLTVHSIADGAPRILPHALLENRFAATAAAPRITPTTGIVADANVGTLISHSALFDPAVIARIVPAAPPPPGTAQVLRISQYEGKQIVGGYTIVVAGKRRN